MEHLGVYLTLCGLLDQVFNLRGQDLCSCLHGLWDRRAARGGHSLEPSHGLVLLLKQGRRDNKVLMEVQRSRRESMIFGQRIIFSLFC